MTRIIAPIFVKNNSVVQTFGFHRSYYLGELKSVLKNITDLEPDEICLLSIDGNLDLIDFKREEFTTTNLPLIIGGGVKKIIQEKLPAERFLLNSAYFDENYSLINNILTKNGNQAIICLLPFKYENQILEVWNSTMNKLVPLCEDKLLKIYNIFSEIIFLDMDKQGEHSGFNFDLFTDFKKLNLRQTIIAGGVDDETIRKAKNMKLAGVMIDNQSLYFNKKIHLR